MSHFIERNRSFLRTLSGVLHAVSSLLLTLGIVWAALKSVALISRLGDWTALREQWAQTPSGILLFILLGLVGRGMSQLLRYMHDVDYQPPWLLRHADKLLYAYAGLCVLRVVVEFVCYLSNNTSVRGHPWWAALAGVVTLVYAAAIALVLAGLGQILKRLMPVIEEGRTLA